MEVFGIVNIPTWIIVFLVTLYVCYKYLMQKHGTLQALDVPGPKPLPFIGNSLTEFFSVTHENDISYNKKYGRIYSYYEGSKPTLRVSDPAILKEILVKQFNNFTDRRHVELGVLDPIMSRMMSVMHGAEWKMTRNVMSPAFTSGKLKQMVNMVVKCSQRLVDALSEKADSGESIDAKDMYISYLLEIVGTCAFGVEINAKSANKNDKSFLDYARRIVGARRMITFFLILTLPQKVASALNLAIIDTDALNFIKNMLRKVIKARESATEKRNDFMQLMLDALKEANSIKESEQCNSDQQMKPELDDKEKLDIKAVFSEDGILAQSILFLTAGFETTSTTLSHLTYAAAANPECQDKLIEEVDRILAKNEGKVNWDTISQMTYMEMFISETLRMYPQLIRLDRQCTQDTQIGDLRIRKGTLVNVMVYAIHHDEEFYPDPEKFDPERFSPENKEQRNPYTFLGWGVGPRNCIGMRFALMEVKLTLIHLLKNFRICRSSKTKEPLVFKRGHISLTTVGGLHVTLSRR